VRALGSADIERITADRFERAHRRIYATGHKWLCFGEKPAAVFSIHLPNYCATRPVTHYFLLLTLKTKQDDVLAI
jgi:hypothetical protein